MEEMENKIPRLERMLNAKIIAVLDEKGNGDGVNCSFSRHFSSYYCTTRRYR